MIELSSRMVLPLAFEITLAALLIVITVFILLWMVMLYDNNKKLAMIFLSISVISIVVMLGILIFCPRTIREVHCIFIGTVDMTEIQDRYEFISCNDDGVFTLKEKNQHDSK